MQKFAQKIADKVVSWAVPVLCAAALAMWSKIPAEAQHYWPVACIAVIGIYNLVVACQDRRDLKRHMQMHDERKAIDDSMSKAFRAILDAEMGALYSNAVTRGYTTEDERRMYDRLEEAYEEQHGNGEAKRRKVHYFAISYEEEWRVQHAKEHEE